VSTVRKNKKKTVLLFSCVILHRLFGLEAMPNPFHMDNVVATSESESENELVGFSGQLPSKLAAQLPTAVVENSSDIQIGPRLQYHSPVTVNQYIMLKGKDDVESLAENPYKNTDTITAQPPEGGNPVGMYIQVNQTFV
jgi:hypothetical protein